jgi:hypothetical protein
MPMTGRKQLNAAARVSSQSLLIEKAFLKFYVSLYDQ